MNNGAEQREASRHEQFDMTLKTSHAMFWGLNQSGTAHT